METKKEVKTGSLLIAQPFMGDPNFKRSVVLLCEHQQEEGTVGFILNKSVNMQIGELMADFPDFESEVFYGGPVQTDTLHYIHTKGDLLDDAQFVSDGIYWGGDFDKLKFLISSGLIESKDIRFFAGYSGWSAGQLNDELIHGSWMTGTVHQNYVFNHNPMEDLWTKVLDHKGDSFTVIAQMPDTIHWN